MIHPPLMGFFSIQLTQGPNLRFPNVHVTQAIKRPQLGPPGARGPNITPYEEAVCRARCALFAVP